MDTHRITVGLASFGALVLIYVVYAHFNRTPQILQREIEVSQDRFADDTNKVLIAGPDGTAVNLENIQAKRWNKDGVLVQEMGYRGQMYVTQAENLVEVNEPFLNIYDPAFTCRVTADAGSLRMPSNSQNHIPKDASFTGNVLVRIDPTPGSEVEPSTIHLDDILFLSDQSLISSNGRIHYKSASIEMEGVGLECVYDTGHRRVEYFWLKDLGYLRALVPEEGLFMERDQALIEESAEVVANPVDVNDAPDQSIEQALAAQYYSCQIRGNTLIKSPLQVVYAQDMINLTELLWPRAMIRHDNAAPVSDTNDIAEGTLGLASPPTTEEAPAKLVEVVMTCDRGIMVAPDDVNTAIVDPCGIANLKPRVDWRNDIDAKSGQAFFQVKDMIHKRLEKDTLAKGPLELTFYVDKTLPQLTESERIVPLNISAQEMARYDAKSQHILFTGDSRCTLLKEDPNTVERYVLEAPRIAIELLDDKEVQAIAADTDLKHLRADGGDVTMLMTMTGSGDSSTDATLSADVITGAVMTCRECDYNPLPGQETFEALGPGLIRFNNAHVGSTVKEGGLSVGNEAFYAQLRDFETLKYHIGENRIVADGNVQQMQFDYFPVSEEGVTHLDQHVQAQANHVEITLIKNEQGSLELGTIEATGEVYYSDKDNNLAASALSYDHKTGWMKMWSETKQPCFMNGVPVNEINFNLKTWELKETSIPGSGSLVPIG